MTALTPEQRVRQASVKMRLIAGRELREYLAGRADFLPGDTLHRTMIDIAASAYAAGLRDGAPQ